MAIVALDIKSIEASKEGKTISGKVNINSTPTITGLKKIALSEKQEAVVIDFKFETFYRMEGGKKEDIAAKLSVSGDLLYATNKANEIAAKWKKEKKMDDEMMVEVLNVIFGKGLRENLSLADALRLPPPIKFPDVRLADQKEYIG